jgi:hypothetical protein
MKVWTVTSDCRDGTETTIHCTHDAATEACTTIVRSHWTRCDTDRHGPMPDDWMEACDMLESRDWWLYMTEHDISDHPDLKTKGDRP